MNYNEYLKLANVEERKIIDRLNEQGQLINENLNEVIKINNNINIVVYSEPRCKDAATVIPFLLKLTQLNKGIKIDFIRREGNEEELERLSGDKRVPTFLIINREGEVLRKFVEFPYGVKKILTCTEKENMENIINDMREGKYNNLIQEDLIRFITNKEYKFKSFSK